MASSSAPAPSGITLPAHGRLLVVRIGDMGDGLLATPMLRALRLRYPAARIDLLTTESAARMLAECPLVDDIYTLPRVHADAAKGIRPFASGASLLLGLRGARYDAVLFANHLTLPSGRRWRRALAAILGARYTIGLDNGHGAFLNVRVADAGFGVAHEVEYALALAGSVDASLPEDQRAPRLADLGWSDIRPQWSKPGAAPRVAIHVGSGGYSLARRWPAIRYVQLARALRLEFSATMTLVGGPEEADLAASVIESLGAPSWATSEVGETSPRSLAELLASARLFIGNDSLPMHLATATGIPVIAIFGPSNASAWGPYAPDEPERVTVIRRADLPCSPCVYRGHTLGTPQGCPSRQCLTELEIGPALAAARRWLRWPAERRDA